MAICQVKRGKNNEISEVLAPNEQKSFAYDSLLDIVNRTTNREVLESQFQNWVGKHINNTTDNKELALGLYKQMYSPLFKDWFGDWTKVADAISHKDDVSGYYGFAFDQNPQLALYEAASQANNSESEKGGAIATFGEPIVKIAQQLFPNAKGSNTTYTPAVGQLDANGEPLLANDRYTNFRGDQRNALNQNVSQPSQSLYQLTDSNLETIPTKASKETIASIKEFLSRLGVKLESVSAIVNDKGEKIGADGAADAVNKIVRVVEGKEDTALTEEAFHIATAIIEQKDPSLFKEMMNKVSRYNMYDQVLQQYRTTYVTDQNKPDIAKIKKEAIGKILAEMYIRNNQNVAERPEMLNQTRNWWQKVLDTLKKFFNRTGMNIFKEDPFNTATGIIKDKEANYDPTKITKQEGEFLQKQQEPLADRITRISNSLAYNEETGKYELNGDDKHLIRSVDQYLAEQDEGRRSKYYEEKSSDQRKADREFKKSTEGAIKTDINDILNRYVNDDGLIRETPLNKTNPSAIDPQDNTFYTALENNIKDRLTTYPSGTKFFHDVNVYNEGSKIAGTIDFMAVKPNGKIDILQFKAPELKAQRADIEHFKQSQYSKEIEELKKILENGYGVKKAEFDQLRTIPIKANYERVIPGDIRSPLSKIDNLTIGDVNVKNITDDILLPIPSTSESTGNTKFDAFLSKVRGLLQRTIDKRDPNVSSIQKAQTIENLTRSIKRLQVQKNATAMLSSAKVLNNRLDDRMSKLTKIVDEINPDNATFQEMGKIANEILGDRDEAELYAHMDRVLHAVLTEKTAENESILDTATKVSRESERLSDQAFDLARKLQTEKFAAKVNINDEFKPEKQLTWYQRMVRSLSQSSSTAGKLLWKLVEKINNNYHVQFQDRLVELEHLRKDVFKWLGNRDVTELYKKFFQYKDNRWTGTTIQQYDKQFYKDMRDAQEKGNATWVKKNIDMTKYNAWFQNAWKERADQVKANAPYSEDASQSQRIMEGIMNEWYNTYAPEKGFVNKFNSHLRDFPLDIHFSDEYKELLKPENAPVKAIWERWNSKLKESVSNGMIDEHQGWSWFPNVRRNLLEKFTTAKAGNKAKDFLFGNMLLEVEDPDFGKLDPLTKKPVSEIHAQFVHDLGKWTEDTNGGYWDFQDKSMDIFKVMGLWEREMIKYDLRTEAEGLAKMLAFTEKNRGSLMTRKNGNLLVDKDTGLPVEDDNNEVNYHYLQDHIDSILYGQNQTNSSAFTLNVPVKAIAEKINKLAGREMVTVPKEDHLTISGLKGLSALNRWMVTKTLGLNVLSAASNLFGGTVNAYMNQGKYFNKQDFLKAEMEMISGRFYDSDRYKKLAGYLDYLHAYVEDKTTEQLRGLSVSKAVKYMSSDQLFRLQRWSDNAVNQHFAIAFINNAIFRDGKIQNVREVARQELNHDAKYAGTNKEAAAWQDALEKRVEELKASPEALLNATNIISDKLELPGLQLHGGKEIPETVSKFRSMILEGVKDALGNTSREDLSLYKRSILYQSVAMFKNWIPRMLDVRGQSLRYNSGTDQYEWGRFKMLGNALMTNFSYTAKGLIKSLGGNDSNLIDVAKQSFDKTREKRQAQGQDFNISEAEYIDMYVKGVGAQFKELGLAAAVIGMVIAARLEAPDLKDNPEQAGAYKWMLRGMDKLQDEISFFYNPQSFSDIVAGSMFPAVGMLLDAERFAGAMAAKGFFTMTGDDVKADKQHPQKYMFRMFPVTKEMLTYLAIMDTDLAKKWDLRVSSRNGSSR